MTTLKQIQLTCPVCEEHFKSEAVLSTNSFGGKRTDFHERAAGSQPLPYFVHTCTRCGYTANERDFGEKADMSLLVKANVWSEMAPRLGSGPLTGSEKYEFAAKVAIWQGAESRRVADLLLRAAWCCVDEKDTEAERYFRIWSASQFEQALASYDGVPGDETAIITYLVGELYRRAGKSELANEWFGKVESRITHPREQQWVLDIARQQMTDEPREWFG